MDIIGRTLRIAAIAICFSMATTSLAQEAQMGQIAGRVVDAAGAIIKGANVYVRRNLPPGEQVRLVTHTDAHGDFKLTLSEGGCDVA